MRTDSKVYSKEFIENVTTYIMNNYNDDNRYINPNISNLLFREKDEKVDNEVKPKKRGRKPKDEKENEKGDKKTQDAHEAIRPTDISLKELPEEMDSKEKKMYKLIWTNTLESCMSPAIYWTITASISATNNGRFLRTSELNEFPGWKIVSGKHLDADSDYQYLLTIRKDTILNYKKVVANVTVKNIKSHYTEAKLVQLLEDHGIGRPSTFSSLVDKIQERGYVKKCDVAGKELLCKDYELEDDQIFEMENKRVFGNEKNKLVIQPLGIIVSEFLEKHFGNILNYDYTKNMENDLDKISKGNKIWYELCGECNNELDNLIKKINDGSKVEIEIDENHHIIFGKYGPVIKCVERNEDGKENISFKSMKKDVDIHNIHNYKLEDIIENKNIRPDEYKLGKYENEDVILKKGKFGLYISWGEKTKNLKELGNRPIESVTFEDVEPFLVSGNGIVREISKNITIRNGKRGDYIFFKTDKMKKPQFYDISSFNKDTKEDYKVCNLEVLKFWLKDKHGIN